MYENGPDLEGQRHGHQHHHSHGPGNQHSHTHTQQPGPITGPNYGATSTTPHQAPSAGKKGSNPPAYSEVPR